MTERVLFAFEGDESPDRRYVTARRAGPRRRSGIPVAYPDEQQMARVSPDGKWLAYVSDESGDAEAYVQAYPEPGGRWMVSSDGGVRGAYRPVWRGDGRELYYQRWRSLMVVPVTPGGGLPFGTPQALFGMNNKSGQGAGYVVDDRGHRILLNERPPADPTMSGARLIQNWSAALAGQ